MKQKTYKIYINNKLRLICGNKDIVTNYFEKFRIKYGIDNVEIKESEIDLNKKVELQQLKDTLQSINLLK